MAGCLWFRPSLFSQSCFLTTTNSLALTTTHSTLRLSHRLWSCATMGHRDVPFLAAVLQECTRRLDRLSSQNLSNVLWSCATLGHADPHMLAAWAQATINKLDSFEPQVRPAGVRDYSNGWGSSRGTRGRWVTAAEDGHGGLRPIICTFANNSMATPNTNLPHLLPPTSPSPLSSPLRACPTQFGPKPRGSIATDTLSFPNLLPATSPPPPPPPQGLSNTAWAFAKLGYPQPQLFEDLALAAVSCLERFTAQGLSNTAWAYAAAGHYQPQLMKRIAQQVGAVVLGGNWRKGGGGGLYAR